MSEFRPEQRIAVDNLTSWDLYFKRFAGVGDVKIPAKAKNFSHISFEELQIQIQLGNPLLVGTDGIGSHARLSICDDTARKALFGLESDEKPFILTLDAVKELLAVTAKAAFNKRLGEIVTTDAEKRMIVDLAKEAGVADAAAWKKEAIETISGYSLTITDEGDERKTE